MANNQDKVPLPMAGQNVGTKRGGPAHLVDGIGPGKGMITPRDAQTITPQAATSDLK